MLYLLGFGFFAIAIWAAYKIGFVNGGKATSLKSVKNALYQEKVEREAYHEKLSKIDKKVPIVANGNSVVPADIASSLLSGKIPRKN